MQLQFCGAAQEVTGSCYLLVVGGVQFSGRLRLAPG